MSPLSALTDQALKLWYREPAFDWTAALPVGNGSLGGMIFGGVERERIQLNEETLWAGGPYDPNSPAALAALPEARRLIFEGQFREAHELIEREMMARPLHQMPYQTAGDLSLDFANCGEAVAYRRELDLREAICRTEFRAGSTEFNREVFCSHPAQVLVARLKANEPGKIAFKARFGSPQDASASVESGDLVLRGVNGSAHGIAGALKFEIRMRVILEGGELDAEDGVLRVTGANAATLLVAGATSYRRYDDIRGEPGAIVMTRLYQAARSSFAQIRAAHVADYQALFEKVELNLGIDSEAGLPTDERLGNFAATGDPQFAALLFQYGRYLLIASSRPGTQPANLQGIWCDSMEPPWDSKYTININTEMNYWPAEVTNLAECHEPLLQMILEIAETGAQTARVNWGAGGWVCHHNTDLWRATAPVDGPTWGFWPMGGAWLCRHLWDHYEFGGGETFLKKIWPVLRGAAEFFLDTLVIEPRHEWLVTCPSLSPENTHPGGVSVCAGPAMDSQILRDLFDHCIAASSTLGVDKDFRERLIAARGRLAPMQIGKAGQLQEWLEDWDVEAPELNHRHVSHLFALHPCDQITPRQTPEFSAAARKTLEMRGDGGTGWSVAWKINFWARLGEGNRALELLHRLITPVIPKKDALDGGLYLNLFDAHPPFQIDGNFGATAGIAEMLLQSHAGEIVLLPALPLAWPEGSVSGLRARGGFEINIQWTHGRLSAGYIQASGGGECRVRYGERTRRVRLGAGEAVILNAELQEIPPAAGTGKDSSG